MNEKLIISNIHLKTENGFNVLSGFLDNDYIFLKVPKEFQLHLNVEWFISIALLEAMATNRDIKVDSEVCVSAQLLEKLQEVQAVFSCWNPDLYLVGIQAKTSTKDSNFSAVGSFFSTGVDSSHTLIRHMDDVQELNKFLAKKLFLLPYSTLIILPF